MADQRPGVGGEVAVGQPERGGGRRCCSRVSVNAEVGIAAGITNDTCERLTLSALVMPPTPSENEIMMDSMAPLLSSACWGLPVDSPVVVTPKPPP